jgi:hypothetical protein
MPSRFPKSDRPARPLSPLGVVPLRFVEVSPVLASRYWLPASLGLIAAAGNYVVLSRATTTHTLVALRADVKPGVPLADEHLYPAAVRGGEPLFQAGVVYSDRQAVFGKTVRRPLKAGELVLRADVENHDYQVDPTLLYPGETTLTLPARLTAVDSRPVPGGYVTLFVRNTGPAALASPLKPYGPFRLLGWSRSLSQREPDLIAVTVAVRSSAGVSEPDLRAVQAENAADRLVKVEWVGAEPVRK